MSPPSVSFHLNYGWHKILGREVDSRPASVSLIEYPLKWLVGGRGSETQFQVGENDFVNPSTAGAAFFRVFIFYYDIKYHILNNVKDKI